jgi:KipI family sensor histidine kinase inhibitor
MVMPTIRPVEVGRPDRHTVHMEFTPVGTDALLVQLDDTSQALDLACWARGRVVAREVVPAARTVLFDGMGDRAAAAAVLGDWRPGQGAVVGDLVEILTVYDGADLADVATVWGCTAEEVVGRHTGMEFVAAFCGFAPGFAYLTGLPASLAVPRLDEPRTRVPAGSVALADTWCGVYPTASPGGWRLIGRTEASLWDVARDPPALLPPGTRVRFVAR